MIFLSYLGGGGVYSDRTPKSQIWALIRGGVFSRGGVFGMKATVCILKESLQNKSLMGLKIW